MADRDIEFLFEIGTMKNVDRGWRQHLAMDCANNLEHSFRVVFLALIIAHKEIAAGRVSSVSEEKLVKMALVHDLAEARTGDMSYVQKVYSKGDEEKASKDLFEGTSLEHLRSESLTEYEYRESLEAKIVKDADNLDIDVELKELEERGSKLPEKWKPTRRLVRDQKLYTESARELWDTLQTADVSSWHLVANKWYKIPEAGK
jgi:putative hydrolases of HD superfamily